MNILSCLSSLVSRPLFLLAAVAATAASAADLGKNLYDVRYRTMPGEAREVLNLKDFWNTNFRPYDQASAANLWTDSQLKRDVKGEAVKDGERASSIGFACDENGLHLYFACGQVGPRCEFYLMTGFAGDNVVRPYYHMYFDGTKFAEYPWLTKGRDYRELKPYTKIEETNVTDRDTLVKVSYDWEGLWDVLPFNLAHGKDNLWRVSFIHWAPGGGRTWGGQVHETSAAGYIRFPEFAPAEKAAIMKHCLRAAARSFARTQKSYFYKPGNGMPYISVNTNAYHLADIAKNPRSYVCYAEDPEFRPTLIRLVNACQGYADKVEGFLALSPDEQDAFYAEAAPKLFNFVLDVEEAYAALERTRMGSTAEPKAEEASVADLPVKDRPFYQWNKDYCRDVNLDKLPATLADFDAKIAAAQKPDARARLEFDKAKLQFRAAQSGTMEEHLATMEKAALAADVSTECALKLLYEYRVFRQDAYRLFDTSFSFEKAAWERLNREAASAADPKLHFLYWKLLGDWIAHGYVSDKRTRNVLMSREHSDERALDAFTRARQDEVINAAIRDTSKANASRRAQLKGMRCEELLKRQANALYSLCRYDEAMKLYEDDLKDEVLGGGIFTKRAYSDFLRKVARRYYAKSDRTLLMKAYELTDRWSERLSIALALEDWELAETTSAEAAAAKQPFGPTTLGDIAFGRGDYAKAAKLYGERKPKESWPMERMWRAAQANYACGNIDAAIANLEEFEKRARSRDKEKVKTALARLKSLKEAK